MPSRTFVLNEWFLHDLRGDNGKAAQRESALLLERLIENPDRITVLQGSAWMTKAYRLMKHHDPLVLELGKVLNQGLLRDSNNCVILGQHELTPLPEELRRIDLKEDAYLFETYFAASADLIVTTDGRLIEKVAPIESLNLILRDEFLRDYLV